MQEKKKYVQPENRGTMFTNQYKKTEKQPDFVGTINIDGLEYKLAAWTKAGNNGDYLSLAVSLPEEVKEVPSF